MFENNFLPFSQSKNECFLALDNFARSKEWDGMGWDGMGRWRVWVSSSTTVFFFGFKITTPPIPLNSSFHISIFQEDFILQPF
jgi:hypothetical protein